MALMSNAISVPPPSAVTFSIDSVCAAVSDVSSSLKHEAPISTSRIASAMAGTLIIGRRQNTNERISFASLHMVHSTPWPWLAINSPSIFPGHNGRLLHV
jgi:hypothetical protein